LRFRRIGQLGIGHFLHIAADEHRIGRKADVFANLAADEVVVSGKDL